MKIKHIILGLVILLVKSLETSAQTITTSVMPSGGATISTYGVQLDYTIGQSFLPETFAGGNAVLTQGFQQPELQIWTKDLGKMIFPGKELKVPFKASGIITPGNLYTAELSDKNGNFDNPVNIGTFRGNISGEILARIPQNAIAGEKYRIRVISSESPFTGTDNGVPLSLRRLLQAKVLPNPFVHTFSIETVGADDEPIVVRVLSLTGHVLDQQRLTFVKGFFKFGENYRPGSYFVEIIQGQQRVIQKVEKLPY